MKSKFSIFNFQFSKGFTLIELLVVMVLLVSIGSITISILVSSLRSANKSNSINKVRQSGDYAITQISKMLTFPYCLDGFKVNATDANYEECDTAKVYHDIGYRAFKPDGTPGDHHDLTCGTGLGNIKDANMLIDSDLNVVSCSFTCSGGGGNLLPTIKIDFTLNTGTSLNSTLTEQNALINFNTSITPRNKWCSPTS